MLCQNSRCMQPLGEYQWGGGYCSQRCMATAEDYERDACAPLLDPSDPTGAAEIAKNRDEVDAMLEAAAIDPRLPRLIYFRKRGKTLRQMGEACGISAMQCDRILKNVTPKLLRACGLRKI